MSTRSRMNALFLALAVLSAFAAPTAFADSDIYFDVTVRGTGKARIHAKIYDNPANRGVTTILAVHGLTGTATTWKPLSTAIYADNTLNRAVKRIIAIDHIGHGESSTPTNLPNGPRFGELLIEDYIDTLIQSIDYLRNNNKAPQVLLGHSMGGLEIQGAQERLLATNSSLKKKGVLGAILISPVPNLNSVWTQPPASDPTPYLVTDPALGTYLDLPAAVAQQGATWRNLLGQVVPNVPSVQAIEQNDWVGIEPVWTLSELTGPTAPLNLARPGARNGAFKTQNGTLLSIISNSQDILTPAVDQDDLYIQLTGASSPLYRAVVQPDAVHGIHISNPSGLINAIKNGIL